MRYRFLQPLLTLAATIFAATLSNAIEVTAVQVDGSRISGKLVSWDASGLSLQVNEQDGTTEIESKQLLKVSWPESNASVNPQSVFLELNEGTKFTCGDFQVQAGQATFTSSLASKPLSIATKEIARVQLIPDAPMSDSTELDGDVIVIYKKKTETFDELTGVLGDISTEQVGFTWEGETIPVKRSKVAALAYFHARPTKEIDPICWLELADGSRLPATKLTTDGPTLIITTPREFSFELPLDAITVADYSSGKLVYLSDLEPIQQRWTPRINLPKSAELIRQHGLPRRDQSYSGSALSLTWPKSQSRRRGVERRTYEKGLALRSRTLCRYRLPKGMTRFAAVAGIDPDTANEGNVTLQVFADKRSVWQSEIDGDDVPQEINVELGGARELKIVVDFGENLDFGDRLHLVEARFSK